MTTDVSSGPTVVESAAEDTAAPPLGDPRQEHLEEAMRGLTYDTGSVQVDEEFARTVANRGDQAAARAEYTRGLERLQQNRRVGAIGAFTRSILIDPDQPEFYGALARALMWKGLAEEAIAAYHSAIERDPANVEYHFELGLAEQQAADFDGAIAAWQGVLDLDPQHVDAQTRLAIAHYYLGDYATAWTYVHNVEALGAAVPPQFRVLLEGQMPEPK